MPAEWMQVHVSCFKVNLPMKVAVPQMILFVFFSVKTAMQRLFNARFTHTIIKVMRRMVSCKMY